jgi:hypothetical protein
LSGRVVVLIPTLGTRRSLLRAVASLDIGDPQLRVRVHAVSGEVDPRVVVSPELELEYFVGPDAGQAAAITAAWQTIDAEWYSWLNDDDFALPSIASVIPALQRYKQAVGPVVVYGDYLHVFGTTARIIRTPKRLRLSHLVYARSYIPGVLPFLNRAAAALVAAHTTQSRDSFDYEWSLVLAAAGARFVNLGVTYGAFIEHPEGRTSAQPDVGEAESSRLRAIYMNKTIADSPALSRVATLAARASAKVSSL